MYLYMYLQYLYMYLQYLYMYLQEYVKFELPPNQPITVSIGVDVKDIPKVSSNVDFHKILLLGLRQGLFNNSQCLLHREVVRLQVPCDDASDDESLPDNFEKIICCWSCAPP